MNDLGLRRLWKRFWFAPSQLHSLCLLRLFFGVTLVLRITDVTGLFRIDRLTGGFPDRGLWPVRNMLDKFYAPYPWTDWLPLPDLFWFSRLEEALLVLRPPT